MVRRYTLVTGAAGFIAFHLIERLLKEGTPVVGVDNLDPFYDVETKRKNLSALGQIAHERGVSFVFLEKNIEDVRPADFRKTPLASVIHLAARAGVIPSLKHPKAYVDTNILGTTMALELCRELGVSDFIFASSSSVYGQGCPAPFSETQRPDEPLSVYGATKRAGELLVSTYARVYKMKAVSLRFFTVYGPKQRPDLAIYKFFKAVLEGDTITMFADPAGGRDYTFVTDTVSGMISAQRWLQSASPGNYECFNIGSGRIITPETLIQNIEAITGRKAILRHDATVQGDMPLTLADMTKSRAVLGYSPQVAFEDGLRHFYRWYRAEAAMPPRKKAA